MVKRSKEKTKEVKRPKRLLFVLMCIVAGLVAAVTIVGVFVVRPYSGIINTFLNSSSRADNEEAAAASEQTAAITEEVEGEGIVLLKNDGALPLSGVDKVNVFGSTVSDLSYGGTGSGSGDSSSNVTLYQGLENAGLTVNPDLVSFYEENHLEAEDMGLVGTDWNLYEEPASIYTDDVISSAKSYSGTAIVVLTRKGGEGADVPMDMADYSGSEAGRSYLELTPNEEDLLAMAEENFENVVVILNSPNVMELGFLEDEGIDAALWIGTPGSTGCNAVGNVLTGAVNPSGKTADTFAYDLTSAPSYYNFGAYDYDNVSYTDTSMFAGTGSSETGTNPYHYVEYVEGIYVGYRYYETAAEDGYIDYDSTVQYPFGYGLSYTTFDETLDDVTDDGTTITATVTVTNTGEVAGKQVVEIYYSAPYTPGGIEKSSVVLGGFDKTKLLEPGESQTLTVSFDKEDMASYDYTGVKAEGGAYVLEAGDYQISLRTDSHTVVDSRTVTVDRDYIYNDANDGARSSDLVAATNQFDDVSFGDNLTYVSRADWAGTMPTERAASTKSATDEQIEALTNPDPIDTSSVTEDVTFGADNGLTLSDMKGLDYDDPQWDALLDQVTLNEMELLVGNGGWTNLNVDSVDKPAIVDCDGPNGVNNIMAGVTGTQLTGEAVLGTTWNKDLARELGTLFADEAKAMGIGGLYAPAVNIHRSPFGGRNYEYVSEDGLLSGEMIAAEIQGIQDEGVYAYLKHFAVNDQETNRDNGGLVTWVNEQAMREIYLKPFEICVKDGGTRAMMSSFNRIGTTPTAESSALLQTVLRGEWEFHGMVITDCTMAASTSDINRCLFAGNDLELNLLQNMRLTSEVTDTAAGHQALRTATHNILYTVANSDALETATPTPYAFQVIFCLVQAALIALCALYFVRRHKKMNRWKAQQQAK